MSVNFTGLNANHIQCGHLMASQINASHINASIMMCQYLILTQIVFKKSGFGSALNYYEEHKQKAYFTGIYDATLREGMIITRVGRVVTCRIKAYRSKPEEYSQLIIGDIPDRFLPLTNTSYVIPIINGGKYELGTAIITTDGEIVIYPGYRPTNMFKRHDDSGLPYDIELTWQAESIVV